jgi:hypothetical protein
MCGMHDEILTGRLDCLSEDVSMTVWTTAPVEAEPDIVLVRWTVREIDAGTRHFVGARADEFTGRVSSKIVNFDPARMVGVTRTGRLYHLEGPPGFNADAEYVWGEWCAANSVTSYVDVSISATGYNPDRAGDPPSSDASSHQDIDK